MSQLADFPEPPTKPYNDAPEVFAHIRENLERARRASAGEGAEPV